MKWTISTADVGRTIAVCLLDDLAEGETEAAPVNLVGAHVVAMIRPTGSQFTPSYVAAQILNAEAGQVSVSVPESIVCRAGSYDVQWLAQWANGTERLYPVNGANRSDTLVVRESMTGTIPSFIGLGAKAPSTLYVPDGGTATVTADHQTVYAGADATITVSEWVTTWDIAEWQSQTTWTAGNKPTITTDLGAFEPGQTDNLLTANGEVLRVHMDTASVWWVTVGSTGGGGEAVEEIGEGATLPANNPDGFDLFVVTGSTDPELPDGTYSWSTVNNTWIL